MNSMTFTGEEKNMYKLGNAKSLTIISIANQMTAVRPIINEAMLLLFTVGIELTAITAIDSDKQVPVIIKYV